MNLINRKPHFIEFYLGILVSSILSLLCFSFVSAQLSPDDFITITPDNVDQLELGYVLPGICSTYQKSGSLAVIAPLGMYDLFTGQKRIDVKGIFGYFSPDENYFWYSEGILVNTQTGSRFSISYGNISDDSQYAAAQDGVYEVATQKKLFATPDLGWFSHDSRYVAIQGNTVYEVKTGRKLFKNHLMGGIVEFSPDSNYFSVSNHGIYETSSGVRIITSLGTTATFSPDSQYVAIYEDGVYSLRTKQRLISSGSSKRASFSPNSTLVAIVNDGVYELSSANLRFKIAGEEYFPPIFVKDTRFLLVSGDGVYDLNTNQKRYAITNLVGLNRSGSLIITRTEGLIETTTGKVKSSMTTVYLAASDKILLKSLQTDIGTHCLVYGINGDKWPYRSGLINTIHTQLFAAPNGNKSLDAKGKPLTTNKQLAVYAQTADNQWFRVANSAWVKASDVKPVSLPESLPIETPS